MNPGYDGQPVIIWHLEDPEGTNMAACNGKEFALSTISTTWPIILCPGCALRATLILGKILEQLKP